MKTSAFPLAAFGLSLLVTLFPAQHLPGQVPSGIEDPAFPAASKAINVAPDKVHTATDLQRGPDGSLWLTGTIAESSTKLQPVVTKLTRAGQIDTTYGTNGTALLPVMAFPNHTHAMAILPHGQVVVAYGSNDKLCVRRLTAQGQQDFTFGSPGLGEAALFDPLSSQHSLTAVSVIAQPDGKLLVLANRLTPPSESISTPTYLFRLNSNGSLDTAFGTSGCAFDSGLYSVSTAPPAMILRPNGDIWVAVSSPRATGVRMARLKSDGSPDPSFGDEGVGEAPMAPLNALHRLKMEPSGSIWVVGNRHTGGKTLLRISPDGKTDPTFATSHEWNLNFFAQYDFVQGRDGRVFVVGSGETVGLIGLPTVVVVPGMPYVPSGQPNVTLPGTTSGVLRSYRPDGFPEPLASTGKDSFVMATPQFKGGLRKMLLEDDGSLLVAGDSGREAGETRSFGVTRYFTGTPRVYLPPVITPEPLDTTVDEGAYVSIIAKTVRNELSPWFFWRKGDELIAVTTSALSFPRVLWTDSGDYTVEARNFAGSDTRSFRLKVNAPPKLDNDLVANEQGSKVYLSFKVTGRPPFTFQWQRSGSNYGKPQLSQDGTGSITLPATPDHAGNYRVVVTNEDGSLTSKNFSFDPPPPYPVITQQPVALEGLAKASLGSLSVEASGQLPMTFQWQKNGINIGPAQVKRDDLPGKSGHVNSTLHFLPFDSPQAADSGNYRCIVTNAAGWNATHEVNVQIYDQPLVRLQQPRQIVRKGEALKISAMPFVNTQIRSATWLHNGRKISGATAPGEYRVQSVNFTHAGTYQIVLTTADGKLISDVCTVAVVDGTERLAVTTAGKSITLTAPAAGPGLAFAWRRLDGLSLSGPTYHGAQTSTLKINLPGANEVATYVCDISWAAYYGPTVTSGPVVLQLATQRPELSLAELPPGQMLMHYSSPLLAINQPTKFTVTGLPRGLSCDPRTGVISGIPMQAGSFTLRIVVANMFGPAPPVTRILTIAPLPDVVTGSYRSLVSDLDMPDIGILQLNVTSNGQVTGKMTFQQPGKPIKVISISTRLEFEQDNRLSGRSARFRLPTDVPTAIVFRGECELQLYWEKTGSTWSNLTASLVNAESSISFQLDKRLFTSTRPTTTHAGYSTMIGYAVGGTGTLRVTAAGDVIFMARLPRSSAFTASSFLVANPMDLPHGVMSSVYAWSGGAAHRLYGWISAIKNDPTASFTADMTWSRGGEGGGTWPAQFFDPGSLQPAPMLSSGH